jgi:hypothetical protein
MLYNSTDMYTKYITYSYKYNGLYYTAHCTYIHILCIKCIQYTVVYSTGVKSS